MFASATAHDNGMTTERDAMLEDVLSAFAEGLSYVWPRDNTSQRGIPGGDSLGERDHVRHIVKLLTAEPRAEPAKGAYDLVAHQEHAVLVTDLTHSLPVALRRRVTTARVLDRFEKHGGHGLWSLINDGQLNLVSTCQITCTLLMRVVRRGHMGHHVVEKRLVRLTDLVNARDRESSEGWCRDRRYAAQ